MSESEKKADRESVRVCIHCQKQITDISYKPEQYHIWIAGNVKGNAHCKLNPDYRILERLWAEQKFRQKTQKN